MSELAWLFTGILIGGCVGISILCCMQINRISYMSGKSEGSRKN